MINDSIQYPQQPIHSTRRDFFFFLIGFFLLAPLSLFGQPDTKLPLYKNQPLTSQNLLSRQHLASVPEDSSWRDTFGGSNGLYGSPYAIATDGNNLYVGGSFNEAGDQTNLNNIARWDGTHWNRMGNGIDGWVRAIAVNGAYVFVGGTFRYADGKEVNAIARWDGTTWYPLGTGVDGEVYSIAINGNDVYVGGRFGSAGGQPASNIAKWTGTHWEALGTGVNGTVFSVAVYKTSICVSGSFTLAGGIAANNIAQWDASVWKSLGTGPNDYVYSLAASGNNLYAGGQFTVMNDQPSKYLAKWDGTTWQSAVNNIDGTSIYAVAMNGKEVYIGGELLKVDQQPISNIAKWDVIQWQPLGSGVNGIVRGFVTNNLDLYVIGNFSLAGGKPCSNIALWHNPTSVVASFDVTGTPPPNGVAATDSVEWTVIAKDLKGNRLANYANPVLPFWVNNSAATQEQWKVEYLNKYGVYIKGNTISDSVFQDGIAQFRTYMTIAENIPISFSFHDTNGVVGTTPSFNVIPGPIVTLDIFPYDETGRSVHGATWNGSDGQPDTVFFGVEFPYYVRRFDRYHNLDVLSSPIEVIVTSDKSGSVAIPESPAFIRTVIPYSATVINNTIDRFRLIALWDGKSFFSDTIVAIPSDLIHHIDQMPKTISLEQNYPNPFNPTTKIKFQIPGSKYVTLRVYDVLGHEVATLINTRLSVGEYETEFSGENLPSGVYYYRLSMEGFTATKKMVLLR